MPVINPADIPPVAVDFMNEVHVEEVEMINVLHELLATHLEGSDKEQEITQALAEVVEHTREHFAREERFMQEGNFPPYPVHKAEHDAFLADFETVASAWNDSKDAGQLKGFLEDVLPAWLDQHISTMDFVTARFLSR